MRSQPINMLGGFNRDDAPSWSVQDVVNWLPVAADQAGTRTSYKLRTPPGLKPYQNIGKGPIRGVHNAEGRLFIVSGQMLYEVSNKGVGIPRGTIPGVGRVRMAHNQIKNGNQLAIVNGQSGYIYNTVTQGFTRITDEGFPGALDVKFIDSYLFYIEPFGRYWLHSDLADGLSYNTLDRGEAETQPDRIVGVAVNQGEVILFGERTVEFFYNTGEATGTFQSKRIYCDVGCAALHTIQNLDNSVMWLGNDGVVYRLDGYRAVPISTRSLEKAIAKYDWKNAFAFTWEDEGHKVYYLTFPDGETFGFDVVAGLWHRRQSLDFKRWRLSSCVAWGRMWIGGDFQNGRLWELDWDYALDGADELVSEFTTGVLHDDGNRIGIPEAQFLFDTGRAETSPGSFPLQPPSPSIAGSASDGVRGIYQEARYVASGGTGALTIKVSSGAIPDGMTLTSGGLLAGAPITTGTFVFTVRVTDGNGMWAEVSDSIKVTASVVALATGTYLFKRGGDTLVESTPITFGTSSRGISISPNGAIIACASAVSPYLTVGRLKADGTGYLQIPIDTSPTATIGGVDVHPTGRWVVSSSGSTNKVIAYKIIDAQVVKTSEATLNQASGPRFSQDGKWIVCGCGIDSPYRGLAVMSFDASTGAIGSPIYPLVSGGVAQNSPFSEWSPDGKFIAACNNNGLVIWGFSGTALTLLHTHQSGAPASGRGVMWSPDGKYLYTVAGSAVSGRYVTAYSWNGASLSAPIYPEQQPTGAPNDSSISNDGKQIALGVSGSTGKGLYVYSVSGSVLTVGTQPTTSASNIGSVRWTGVGDD